MNDCILSRYTRYNPNTLGNFLQKKFRAQVKLISYIFKTKIKIPFHITTYSSLYALPDSPFTHIHTWCFCFSFLLVFKLLQRARHIIFATRWEHK